MKEKVEIAEINVSDYFQQKPSLPSICIRQNNNKKGNSIGFTLSTHYKDTLVSLTGG
jgi:hypothetical protein